MSKYVMYAAVAVLRCAAPDAARSDGALPQLPEAELADAGAPARRAAAFGKGGGRGI